MDKQKKNGQKNHGKMKITLWSIVLVIALGVFSIAFFNQQRGSQMRMFSFADRNDFVIVKDASVSETIREISLEWISGEVKILKSTDDSMHIVQTAQRNFPDNQLFTQSINGEKLTIKDQRGKHFGFNWGQSETDLTLYLPEQQYEEFYGSFVSSDVSADDLQVKTLKLTTVSGNVRLSGNFEQIDAHSTSGDLQGNQLNATHLEVKTVSGDVDVAGSLTDLQLSTTSGQLAIFTDLPVKNLDVSSVSGNMTLTMPDNEGFTAQFDKVSGNFSSDFATTQDNKAYIYKNGTATFKMKTTSGNFRLLMNHTADLLDTEKTDF